MLLISRKPPRNRAARTGGPRFVGLGTNPLEPPQSALVGSNRSKRRRAESRSPTSPPAQTLSAMLKVKRLRHGDDMQVFLIEPKTTKSVTFDYPLLVGKPNGMNFRVSVFTSQDLSM